MSFALVVTREKRQALGGAPFQNGAVMKASYPGYESEARALLRIIPRECGEFCDPSSFDPVISVKAFTVMAILNRLKSVKAWLGLLSLGCALFSSSCANDEGSSDDSSQHDRHHGSGGGGGGGGRYGHGQGGMFDQSNPSGSPSPVPGQ